jgi:hypothetical protein
MSLLSSDRCLFAKQPTQGGGNARNSVAFFRSAVNLCLILENPRKTFSRSTGANRGLGKCLEFEKFEYTASCMLEQKWNKLFLL